MCILQTRVYTAGYMKMVPNSYFEIWSSGDLKTHPGAKNGHKMIGEG